MTPAFLDFEASSLSNRSHPIEIGCAWIEDGRVVQYASLLRPHPTWAPDWSAESAAVHRVTIRGDSYRLREKRRSGILQKAGAAPENPETA
jgi:hypothetical protein